MLKLTVIGLMEVFNKDVLVNVGWVVLPRVVVSVDIEEGTMIG